MKESGICPCTIIESYTHTCTIYFSYCFVTKLTFHQLSVERKPIGQIVTLSLQTGSTEQFVLVLNLPFPFFPFICSRSPVY